MSEENKKETEVVNWDHLKNMVKEWNTVNPAIEVVPDPEEVVDENKESEYYSYIIDQDSLL
jgi:hypothetical protein